MLSYESEKRLKNLLVALGEGEREMELCRARLCSIPDFSPYSAFQRVDRDANALIYASEIVNFLRDNAVFHVGEGEAYNLVRFFDADGSATLRQNEFIQMLLPCEDNMLRSMAIDRPTRRVGHFDYLPRDIEMAMTTVFEREIDYARKVNVLKRELLCQYDFSHLAAFRSIDRMGTGRIDTVMLGSFLRN